jgi:hypothetical protein
MVLLDLDIGGTHLVVYVLDAVLGLEYLCLHFLLFL